MRCWAPRPHSPPPLVALLSPPRLSTGLNNINYARRRGTRARDRIYIYIYTFAHSGVRQVSNAIINYPTVFCYRACAPPYLLPCCAPSVYITFSEIPILVSPSPDSSFFSTANSNQLFALPGRGIFLLPLFFLSRGAKTSFLIGDCENLSLLRPIITCMDKSNLGLGL